MSITHTLPSGSLAVAFWKWGFQSDFFKLHSILPCSTSFAGKRRYDDGRSFMSAQYAQGLYTVSKCLNVWQLLNNDATLLQR